MFLNLFDDPPANEAVLAEFCTNKIVVKTNERKEKESLGFYKITGERKDISHAGNRTRAAWVRARNPNH